MNKLSHKAVAKNAGFYSTRFQRLDVPFSMVIEWCIEQYGTGVDPKQPRWWTSGSDFHFAEESDYALFVLKWS